MPKSFMYGTGYSTTAYRNRASTLAGGTAAGIIVGIGIELSSGLFYTATTVTMILLVLACGMAGFILSHVMGRLLTRREVSFVGRSASPKKHMITGDVKQMIDLLDYRSLRKE